MTTNSSKYNTIIVIVGILFIIWGVLGLMDSQNYAYAGYNTDDNWAVIEVEEGSPAEAAGIMEGDILKSTGGIAVTDTKAQSQRERAAIGETRTFVLERAGEEMSIDVTYAPITSQDKTDVIVAFIIALLFILLGIYTAYKYSSSLSNAFSVFAICFGFIFTNGPYISSSLMNDVVNVLSTGVFLFAMTALAMYMLRYPPTTEFVNSSKKKWIYAPMVLLLLTIVVLEILKPDATGTLNMVVRLMFGAFIIAYFLIALITLIRKYLNADSDERRSSGLNMMLLGTLLGIVPILVYFTLDTLVPGIQLPLDNYVFYTFAAIPVFFTIALAKLNNTATTE